MEGWQTVDELLKVIGFCQQHEKRFAAGREL
jgi:hypothetical protein